jgi:translation initiation factor 2B subunit (eIF-2B alpha/beta/delta family)
MAVLAGESTPGLEEFKAKLQKVTDWYTEHKDDPYGARKVMKQILDREMVNHPDHYQGNNFEVIDIIEDYNLGFSLGNAIKYILRADKKGNRKQDLKKAIWYIQREIDREDV